MGDEFGSAITYHTQRALQVESLAASPFEVAHVLGFVRHLVGGGARRIRDPLLRRHRRALDLGRRWERPAYLWLVWAGWRSRASNLALVTALLTVLVVFAPVLSPQFLLWILPVSACAYGLGKENLVLLVAILLTQIVLAELRRGGFAGGRLRLAARGEERHAARLPLPGRRADPAGGTRAGPRAEY